MQANPISYSELDSFRRQCLIEMTAWEVGVLMRLDDAVLSAKSNPTVSANDGDPSDAIAPTTDRKAVRSLLSGIGQRMRARKRG